jgi:hypothetical protein
LPSSFLMFHFFLHCKSEEALGFLLFAHIPESKTNTKDRLTGIREGIA